MVCPCDWPEPVVRVQSLSESGKPFIPERYIKPPTDRPSFNSSPPDINIPIIDLAGLTNDDITVREATLREISEACREWGFFQVVNHGLSGELVDGVREIWREFFHESMEVKQKYANSPKTYEGYGSRLGLQKGAILDWSDYYFLHYLPSNLKDHNKWPATPSSLRETVEEYSKEIVRLGSVLLEVFSINLGLQKDYLQKAFGGEDVGACLRVNFYPKCPQPDLTLGLSSHSDPGGITFLLPDENVSGLQVRRGEQWITVKPARHAIIANIGDQIQVLSNAIYKSVEHRVIVNPDKERVSLAYFFNPKSDLLIHPAPELVTPETPPLYPSMTFDEYRLFIRTRGPQGKSQVESLKSPR
ncbi:Non-heme dioxygenase N-terminal domain-containing protein [Artemisia annua]|uniref:Non-heme dioxygenase N-terminal domain-containing protein n=1 Tax=Artemisia annua TaxID=35608 RepID=A0A2U1NGM2_ARTAN|nr:Non-heme dioxygenase N-terminal domain-containing protein [Artemisia annua]